MFFECFILLVQSPFSLAVNTKQYYFTIKQRMKVFDFKISRINSQTPMRVKLHTTSLGINRHFIKIFYRVYFGLGLIQLIL